MQWNEQTWKMQKEEPIAITFLVGELAVYIKSFKNIEILGPGDSTAEIYTNKLINYVYKHLYMSIFIANNAQ